MDQFGASAELNIADSFPLLGKRLELRTNSDDVLTNVQQTFAHWQDSAHWHEPPVLSRTGPQSLQLEIIQMPASGPIQPEQPYRPAFTSRKYGETYLYAGEENVMTVQLDRGYALAFVSEALVANRDYFQRAVIDTLGLLLACHHDREPLHSAAMVWQDVAFLFAGPSKVGKSTLCYACLRQGFQLLAEDVVYVQRDPALRILGHSKQIHLLPDAPKFFPELASLPVQLMPSGKQKLVVPTLPTQRRHTAEQTILLILARSRASQPALEPMDLDDALVALSDKLDGGFSLYPGAIDAARALLANRPTYRFTVGSDLEKAVALLKTYSF